MIVLFIHRSEKSCPTYVHLIPQKVSLAHRGTSGTDSATGRMMSGGGEQVREGDARSVESRITLLFWNLV
jgi:hypothetical protein